MRDIAERFIAFSQKVCLNTILHVSEIHLPYDTKLL